MLKNNNTLVRVSVCMRQFSTCIENTEREKERERERESVFV